MEDTKDYIVSAEARAKRLKRLRNLANLTRNELSEAGEVNVNTLAGWEQGKYGGLPPKGAEKILKAVAKFGVRCSIDWLMHEIGKGPALLPDYDKVIKDRSTPTTERYSLTEEQEDILRSLSDFKKKYKNVADLIVEDDGMLPMYIPGDYVAGIKYFKNDISSTINQNCIVQISSGEILLRKVKESKKSGTFNLWCINIDTALESPVLQDQELVSSAPVVWLRRILS